MLTLPPHGDDARRPPHRRHPAANKVKSIDARARQAREVILSIERKPEIDPVLPGNGISICSAR